MRARNIKPGFFINADLIALPPLARILFLGLWCLADRAGRLEDRPTNIKFAVLPGDRCNVDNLLGRLQERGFIDRYTVDGKNYIQIENFQKHQNPHPREAASNIPCRDEAQPRHCPNTTLALPSRADSPSLIPDSPSLIPDVLIPTPTPATTGVNNELLDELMGLAASVRSAKATWSPTKADRRTVAAMLDRFSMGQLRTELLKFKAYAPQRDYQVFGKTFASWMGRVTPDVVNEKGSRIFTAAEESQITTALALHRQGKYEEAQFSVSDELWIEVMRRSRG